VNHPGPALDAIVILRTTRIPTPVGANLPGTSFADGDMDRNENAAVHAASNCDALGKTLVSIEHETYELVVQRKEGRHARSMIRIETLDGHGNTLFLFD
jgi:hypothetical protein